MTEEEIIKAAECALSHAYFHDDNEMIKMFVLGVNFAHTHKLDNNELKFHVSPKFLMV